MNEEPFDSNQNIVGKFDYESQRTANQVSDLSEYTNQQQNIPFYHFHTLNQDMIYLPVQIISQNNLQNFAPPNIQFHYNNANYQFQSNANINFESISHPISNTNNFPSVRQDIEKEIVSPPRVFRYWREEEDTLLLKLKKNKRLSWREISTHFPKRTLNACQFRWRKLQVNKTTVFELPPNLEENSTDSNDNNDCNERNEDNECNASNGSSDDGDSNGANDSNKDRVQNADEKKLQEPYCGVPYALKMLLN